MPLHFLWTHSLHCEHSMEMLPTPLQQTAQGYLPDFFRTSRPTPETMNLVFFMLTHSPFISMPAFHASSLEVHSSWGSMMRTRSSTKSSSHDTPVRNLYDNASSTKMKSSGLKHCVHMCSFHTQFSYWYLLFFQFMQELCMALSVW